jgi:hypothetical protein
MGFRSGRQACRPYPIATGLIHKQILAAVYELYTAVLFLYRDEEILDIMNRTDVKSCAGLCRKHKTEHKEKGVMK